MTMQVIEHIEVGSGGAASIDFTSIPATYTDLYLTLSARTDGTGNATNIEFNGSGTGYSNRSLQGNGASASSFGTYFSTIGNSNDSTQTSNTFGSIGVMIPNYSSSTQYKSYSSDSASENNATTAYMAIVAGLWSNTDAITSLSLTPVNGSWVQYSSATLYGITAGSDGTTTVS